MNQSEPKKTASDSSDKRSLFKLFAWAQGAAFAGTAVDFIVTIFFTEVFHIWYVVSTALGSLTGAITNFLLGRYYVFQSTERNISHQAYRYAIVSLGSLILNTAGVWLLTEFIHNTLRHGEGHDQDYIVAKVIVAVLVAVFYNFILQKNYVYKQPEEVDK